MARVMNPQAAWPQQQMWHPRGNAGYGGGGSGFVVPPPPKISGVTSKSGMGGFGAPPTAKAPMLRPRAGGGQRSGPPAAFGRSLTGPPPPKGMSAPKAPPTAFAILPTETGPVLAPPNNVEGMLKADWALFLEMSCYSLHGQMTGRVAYGIEEVSEAIAQATVSVLFIPVSCGHGGETAVRGVAMLGGRGYIVGAAHPLYEDIDDWGAAAILISPLTLPHVDTEPPEKRRKTTESEVLATAVPKSSSVAPPTVGDGAQPPSEAPPTLVVPVATEKDLKRELKILGTAEALQDRSSIPRSTEAMRDKFLVALNSKAVFTIFTEVFSRAKGVAHRKAILYVVHELFMGNKGLTMKGEGCRVNCLEHFLLRIGDTVKRFRTDERQAYIKAAKHWEQFKVLLPAELSQLKDAWDMD